MDQQWNKTWYTGHDACKSCASGGQYANQLQPKKACCGSCAQGGQCESQQAPAKACCSNCGTGQPCQGTNTVDRHHYDRGCRGVGEFSPTLYGEGSGCDHPDSRYWPMHRPANRTRAGLPTHRDHPELYDERFLEGNQGVVGEGVLAPSRYRRVYTFEKEPYFFAKEYEDGFCHKHPSPWSEDGYYYYKDAHLAKKDQDS